MDLKNQLIKGLIAALLPAKKRPIPESPQSILIVSTTAIGDTLWGTPAIRALRRTYPSSYIAALTSPVGHEVLRRSKHLDEIFVLEKPLAWSAFKLIPALRKRTFDTIFLFHSSQRVTLPLCALTGAPRIIGTAGQHKGLDDLLTHALPYKEQHEIARRLELTKLLSAHIGDYALEFPLSREEEREAAHFTQQRKIPSHIPLIGLHPGAQKRFKQWPPECFIELGRRLYQHMGCQIIVSGDRSEAMLAHEIASQIPGAIPLAGEMSLGGFSALLKRYSLFVSNDTGPMHLAFAMRTPTVALFGPTNPAFCGPYHAQHVRVLSVAKTCRPCLKKECAEPFCLLQISPDAVYQAALELFYNHALV